MKSTKFFNFYSLLEALLRCKSSDPRDKVFALLSTAEPEAREAIAINYESPVSDVYLDAALYLICTRRSLSLLYRTPCGNFETRKEGVTWVPDWSDSHLRDMPLHCSTRHSGLSFYRATCNLPVHINHNTTRSRLTVKVIIQGRITHRCDVDDRQGVQAILASSFTADYPPTKQDTQVAMLQTLVADRWEGVTLVSRLIYLGLLHPGQESLSGRCQCDMRMIAGLSGSKAGMEAFSSVIRDIWVWEHQTLCLEITSFYYWA